MTNGEPSSGPASGPADQAGATGATGAAAAPAGWYPDQQAGGQRYWDGTRWTDDFQPHGAAPAGAVAADPAWLAAKGESDARQWAMFAHLSALFALIIGLPWVGPLVIYLTKKDDHPYIAEQAREALNFNLSFFIYLVVGTIVTVVLSFVLIGLLLIPVLIAMGIAWIVFVIIAAVKANGGQQYRYPLTIRMVS